jgi:hypothetical protein
MSFSKKVEWTLGLLHGLNDTRDASKLEVLFHTVNGASRMFEPVCKRYGRPNTSNKNKSSQSRTPAAGVGTKGSAQREDLTSLSTVYGYPVLLKH